MRDTRDLSSDAPAGKQGVGARVPRKEDDRLMRGRGQFVADIRLAGLQDVAFVRSPVAHARIRAIHIPERYRDVVFHVQTEDSGRANPHVITHLFHGGNIIASVKSDYSDLLVEGDLELPVRKLMETQHKSMLKQLSRGEFDGAIGERLGPEIFRAGAGAHSGGEARGEVGGAAAADRQATPRPRASSETGSSDTDRTPGPGRRTPSSPSAGSASNTPLAAGRAHAEAHAERTLVTPERRDTTSGLARVFGERVVSEKPLDEVVLDYLVENARKRKRQPKS